VNNRVGLPVGDAVLAVSEINQFRSFADKLCSVPDSGLMNDALQELSKLRLHLEKCGTHLYEAGQTK
jgi:hypothetical protein